MIEVDPYTKVYDALWELVKASSSLTALVTIGNRINLNEKDNPYPLKLEVSDADVPEMILTSTGMSAKIMHNSSGSSCIRTYQFLISTGDMRLGQKLLPIEWMLFAALCDWKAKLGALTWKGYRFCKRLDVTSVDNGFADPERNRGIQGWSAIWGIEVEMHFPTADLITFNGET